MVRMVIVAFVALVAAEQALAQFWGESDRSITYQGSDYGTGEARRVQNVVVGTVEDVRIVRISSRSNAGQYVGGGVGAALGALAGRQVARSSGSSAQAAAAIILGGIGGVMGTKVGNKVAEEVRESIEFVVSLPDGRVVAVTQEIDPYAMEIKPGDRVRLIGGANTRVVKMQYQH